MTHESVAGNEYAYLSYRAGMDTPYETRKFTIRDPDGNELGFVRAQVSGTSSR